jgi:hypothetical protein
MRNSVTGYFVCTLYPTASSCVHIAIASYVLMTPALILGYADLQNRYNIPTTDPAPLGQVCMKAVHSLNFLTTNDHLSRQARDTHEKESCKKKDPLAHI